MIRLAAVILAAGFSSRMGEFKPLLPLGHEPALARIVRNFRKAGVADVNVVVGHRADEVASLCRELGVRSTENPDYASGMFTSVQVGIRTLPHDAEGFFLLPVDIPLVRTATLHRLAEDFTQHRTGITHPTFAGERGHPPLLARELISAILTFSGQGGLRAVLEQYESEARDVAVADQGILLDMDTPQDHALLQARADIDYPLDAECEALFELAQTPLPVREHCRAVAEATRRMVQALNQKRTEENQLDAALAHSAALVHDLAKGRPCHALAGAELLNQQGFDRTAKIVIDHPDLALADHAPLTEREIVFLADKFVQGTRIVPIRDRYLAKLDRYRDDTQATTAIRQRLQRAETVLRRYCDESQARLPELLENPE
ncbi:MAG: DVU_1551 family NTP transferase [Desulfovibrio sp.]